MGHRVSGLRAISEALADQIRETLEAVDEIDIQVEPRIVLTPTPLTIDITPGSPFGATETAAFNDDGALRLTIRARINTPDFDAAYDVLISLMDETDDLHLASAVLEDTTLGGLATDVHIAPGDQSGLNRYEDLSGMGSHLGFQVTALVFPARS
jgi:hypothetical protein